jgi:hypothetical protein
MTIGSVAQLHAVESSSKEEVESMRVKMQKADEQQRVATIALSERESKVLYSLLNTSRV